MPLRATDKLEIYIFRAGAMVFYMIDENGERVRCSISERALRRLDPSMKSGKQTKVGCLLRAATWSRKLPAKKFDGEQFAEGGDTIQILEADVPQEERGD